MKRTPLRKISKKKQRELRNEVKIREQLMERSNGRCEYCGQLPDFRGLHPHEELFRSHGGKMNSENSKMACGRCHSKRHGIIEPLEVTE